MVIFVAAVSMPLWGALSDRVGRKPVLLCGCGANLVLGYPAFLIMGHSAVSAVAAQLVLGVVEAAYLAVIVTVYCELFPLRVRLSGVNLGHNLAEMVAGGTAPYVATWLIAKSGIATAPYWWLLGTALIYLFAVLTIKETDGKPLPISG